MWELSYKQAAFLRFLVEHDFSISYGELLDELGLKSANSVKQYYDVLVHKGFVERLGRGQYGLTEKGEEFVAYAF